MVKRKKRRKKQSQPSAGVNPRALQIIQRKFGGRRPDRTKVFKALIQEARRELKQSEYDVALELANQAERLAQSEDEHQTCDTLQAEIYFQRGSNRDGHLDLDDLELAALLAPEETRYRVQLARALEQAGQVEKALDHYRAAAETSHDSGVGFLWSVAALRAGKPLPQVDLAPAEKNTLDVVRGLTTKQTESTSPTEPLLGDSPALWQGLIQMRTDPDAAPEEELKRAVTKLDGTKANSIANYYLGVAALRAGDIDAAWQAMTAAREAGYTSSWMAENFSYLARAETIQYAEAERWKKVVDVGEPALHKVDDRILAETVSLAYFHLGYGAAQEGDWEKAASYWEQAEQHDSNRHLAQNLALAKEQREDWSGAAEAWRDVARRRPRKEDHPDYLTDNQVAGIWQHAADCYERAGIPPQAITCLQNALKYAPDDVEIRHELSTALIVNDQTDAAENELERILERDPDNVAALVRLGELYTSNRWSWWRHRDEVVDVLTRALELEPNHSEAREILGDFLLEEGDQAMNWGLYAQAAEHYRQGLERLPDYAPLHAFLGEAERMLGHDKAAREHLLKAYELDPSRVQTVGHVLHELLHIDEKKVRELLPDIRENVRVVPQFWISQGTQALECELGDAWAEQFFDEALALVDKPSMPATRATVLVDIVIGLSKADAKDSVLDRRYRKQIERDVPNSGAKETLEALTAIFERGDFAKAERLLDKARRKARKAGEDMLAERIDMLEEFLFAGPLGLFGRSGPGGILGELFR